MRIGELAHAAKCTPETIRFYEREGLLPSAGRTGSNYRSYGDAHLERLRFIRNCRALDMTHEEIRSLLALLDQPDARCGAANQLLDEHIGHVDTRLNELMLLKQQLTSLRAQCQSEQDAAGCGILQGLVEMENDSQVVRHTHLG